METSTKIIKVSAFLSLILVAVFVYFFTKKDNKPIVKEKKIIDKPNKNIQPKEKKVDVAQKTENNIAEDMDQIKLNTSDDAIWMAISGCSSYPDFNKKIKADRIIQRFVASIENISNGESPVKNLDFLNLKEKFSVDFKSDHLVISSDSYRRYNHITEIFLLFDEKKLIELYNIYSPLLEKSYKELGIPNSSFYKAFIKAIDILVKTPVISGNIYLKKDVISYSFMDSKLEELNNAQKQFLRMGPSNIKKIKKKLLSIKELLIKSDLK